MHNDFFTTALDCLLDDNVDAKLERVSQFKQLWKQGFYTLQAAQSPIVSVTVPGRPAKPEMVSALAVDKRKLSTPEGRAALVHALAHIEFNAINLALDAIYRFRDLPLAFYDDWLRVAAEEASHFVLLRNYLGAQGYDYGDFNAHNGLWEMAVITAHDPLVRMALVPRVLEARGLDVLPGLIHKLVSSGAQDVAPILEKILHDEVGHVAIGNHWYAYLCKQRGLEPLATFRTLLQQYNAPKLRGPLHTQARLDAGFSAEEMKMLEASLTNDDDKYQPPQTASAL